VIIALAIISGIDIWTERALAVNFRDFICYVRTWVCIHEQQILIYIAKVINLNCRVCKVSERCPIYICQEGDVRLYKWISMPNEEANQHIYALVLPNNYPKKTPSQEG